MRVSGFAMTDARRDFGFEVVYPMQCSGPKRVGLRKLHFFDHRTTHEIEIDGDPEIECPECHHYGTATVCGMAQAVDGRRYLYTKDDR